MTVDEVFQTNVGFGLGSEAIVTGFLVVSDKITYLCASETSQEKAILVIAPWLTSALLDADVPVNIGSMLQPA